MLVVLFCTLCTAVLCLSLFLCFLIFDDGYHMTGGCKKTTESRGGQYIGLVIIWIGLAVRAVCRDLAVTSRVSRIITYSIVDLAVREGNWPSRNRLRAEAASERDQGHPIMVWRSHCPEWFFTVIIRSLLQLDCRSSGRT